MFLDELQKKEQECFLDLAYYAMLSSGKINDVELEVYESYKYECGLPDFKHSESKLDDLLLKTKTFSKESKRIILIELIGIWAADQKWEDGEIEMMHKIGNAFNIPSAKVNRYKRWSNELRQVVEEGYKLIMEK